ncbi:uncharacterized protein K02A2.6-like [Drosophila ficusphila]|uniref:uncharacterized protein K02A2.6-like n=1 Tax=Drosophila ficusphila TaxID=30025 RepID=UPI001C89B793|nr:uncharacterized protein K02A2.6-like [Drosophila ficusphila]
MSRTPFPTGPWICVASDLLGPLPNGEFLLVFIDYYSRYIEFKFLRSITSTTIIDVMKEIFCRPGFPKYLRTDNGRQYISSEFKEYCKVCGIEQIRTPPYWPQANGEVENINKLLVKRLKIAYQHKNNYKEEIQKFVLMYNVTPHSSTGSAPTQLMFNRLIRDKMPGIQDLGAEVLDSAERDQDCVAKQKGKESADKKRGAKEIDIGVGDKVLIKNVVFPHKLTPNFDPTEYDVLERKGNIAIVSRDGRRLTRNISHLKKIPIRSPSDSSSDPGSFPQVQVTPPEELTNTEQSEHQPAQTAGMEPPSLDQGLKLKLIKKGGMWEPASKSEGDGGSSDVSADVNDWFIISLLCSSSVTRTIDGPASPVRK